MSDTASLPVIELDEALLEKAKALSKTIDLCDSRFVLQYGAASQAKIARFTDTVLDQLRSREADETQEVLTSLLLSLRELDADSLDTDSFFSKIPLLGALADPARKFTLRYDAISSRIDQLLSRLETVRMNLLKDISLMESLYQRNEEYLQELDLCIAAGKLKLDEVRGEMAAKPREGAKNSSDLLEAQKMNDAVQAVDRFEKKLYDLSLSRMIALQSCPQLRLIQNGDQTLVQKIQASILTTIPLWKNQAAAAIALLRQKKALELQKTVVETTGALLEKNSRLLRSESAEVARESNRGILEIETLKKASSELLATIEETLSIQAQGSEKRAGAELELQKLDAQLAARKAALQASN